MLSVCIIIQSIYDARPFSRLLENLHFGCFGFSRSEVLLSTRFLHRRLFPPQPGLCRLPTARAATGKLRYLHNPSQL